VSLVFEISATQPPPVPLTPLATLMRTTRAGTHKLFSRVQRSPCERNRTLRDHRLNRPSKPLVWRNLEKVGNRVFSRLPRSLILFLIYLKPLSDQRVQFNRNMSHDVVSLNSMMEIRGSPPQRYRWNVQSRIEFQTVTSITSCFVFSLLAGIFVRY
jgi:hypothetical protein